MPHIDISEFDEVAAELPFVKSQSTSKKYFLVKLPTDVTIVTQKALIFMLYRWILHCSMEK